MNHFERKAFVKQFGEPFLEARLYRFYIIDELLKAYSPTYRKWFLIHEDTSGVFYRESGEGPHIHKIYLNQDIQEELKETLIERILLGKADEVTSN